MSGRDHQGPNSLSGWMSVAASISVAVAVVGFCWEDVQSASSAVQNKISRNLKKSLGVVTSSFKSGLSGVAAGEDIALLKDDDDPDDADLSEVGRKQQNALSAKPQERILQEHSSGIPNSKLKAKRRRSRASSSYLRMLQKKQSKKRKTLPSVHQTSTIMGIAIKLRNSNSYRIK